MNRIGIVLPYLKRRGTENQASKLAAGFTAKGDNVLLFLVQGWGEKDMYKAFRVSGTEVIDVGPPVDVNKKKVRFSRLCSLSRLIRQKQCNVLLSRAGMTNNITVAAGMLAHIPTIAVLSGSLPGESIKAPCRIMRCCNALKCVGPYAFVSKIVSVSNEASERFAAQYPLLANRIHGIPNGVDLPAAGSVGFRQFSVDINTFSFCYSGSIEIHRKGLDTLIQAIEILVREYQKKKFKLILIGTGNDEKYLQETIASMELQDHVFFAGEQKHPRSLMAQFDAFVLPSRREGFPNALLEAMSLGCCCIAADCDYGPREIISHEENGLLVPPSDSKSLADAMMRVINDKHLREKLGQKGKETVKNHFTVEKMVDKYYSLIENIV